MEQVMPVSFGDRTLQVLIEPRPDQFLCTVHDKRTGAQWGPAPLLALDVHDNRLRRTERFTHCRIDVVQPLADGVHVSVSAAGQHVSIGLWVRVCDGELVVRIAPDEVYERKSGVFRVFAVDVLPGLLRVGPAGQLLLPINQGMLSSPVGRPALRDRFLLFMEQDRWELTSSLPLCGAVDRTGGMVALATEGACDAECRVETDGQDHGSVGFACSLRRRWPDPVDPAVRELRFVPVPPGEALAVAAAKRLRRHAFEDLGKQPLRVRREESREVAYLLEAYTMKLFYGIEDEGADREGKKDRGGSLSYRDYMTFAEAGQCLRRLREAGVSRILTQSVGWNARGHDGLYPTRFPVNERAGGEAGFRALLAAGKELGYQMSVHDNFSMNLPHSPDWDPECVIQDVYGQPLVHGWWGGGVEYASWPLALPLARLEEHLARVRSLGVEGLYYADYMMQPLEVNYHPRWHGPRGAHNRGMVRVLDACREAFGACGTEFGTFPGAIAADYIVTAGSPWHLNGCNPEWPITQLFGPVVPVWSLALHGLVMLEGHPGTTWCGAMEVVLKGLHPRDEWSVRPGQHPVLDAERIGALRAIYDLCVGRFGRLQCEELTAAQWAGDVQTSSYADGTEIVADFKREELVVNGESIERPAALQPKPGA